jgi:hypothetical protein
MEGQALQNKIRIYNKNKNRVMFLGPLSIRKGINFPGALSMIFYTLQGPTSKLEIYAEKIKLVKRTWAQLFSRKEETDTWVINDLTHFEISIPKFLFFSGKIEWATLSGDKGMFRFSTNAQMVKKIEIYLQKRVLKNQQSLTKEKNDPSTNNLQKSSSRAA